WFESFCEDEPSGLSLDEVEYAEGIHDAIPLFVLARLLVAAGGAVAEPDFDDAARRISAWEEVPLPEIRSVYRRARRLADWLVRVDAGSDAAPSKATGAPRAGSAVVLRKAGVCIVLGEHEGKLQVAMLGRPRRPVVRFAAAAAGVVALPPVG